MATLSSFIAQLGAHASAAMISAQQHASELKPYDVWLPPQASTNAPTVDLVWDFINYLCYFFFGLVVILMIIFVVKYRHRRGTPFRSDYPHHNTPLELAWSIIPTIIVIGLFWWGFKEYLVVRTAPKNSYDIQVTAQKWQWNFTYPNGAQSIDQQLYIPVGKPVRLIMRSNDVLHALFIPDFRAKQDIVPGRYSYLWFQCDYLTGMPEQGLTNKDEIMAKGKNGFDLYCAEYCGTNHSNMFAKVYVLGPEQFDEWLTKTSNWIEPLTDEELMTIAAPRLYARCSQCHTLDGTESTGPTWKGLYERVSAYPFVGPGKEYETPEDYIRTSILVPSQTIAPPLNKQTFGNSMPTFKGQVPDRGIDGLIQFMRHLDQFDSKGKPLAAPATAGSKP